MKKEERERVSVELAALKGREIDLSDMPELTDEFWEHAVAGKFYKPIKQKSPPPILDKIPRTV